MTPSTCTIICGAGYVSGKEIMVLQLAKGLLRQQVPVELLVSSWNDGEFPSRLQGEAIPFRRIAIGFFSSSLSWQYLRMTLEQVWRWPGLAWDYWRYLSRTKPTVVVHTNWHHLLLLLPFVRVTRDLLWLHEIVPPDAKYRRIFRLFERRVSYFACVSGAVARSLSELGVSDGRVRVIHNGLDDPVRTHPKADCQTTSTPIGFRVGIVGQIGEWKGHDDAVRAIGILRRQGLELELHVFGKGDPDYVESLRRLVAAEKVEDLVEWHGFVSDRSSIYDNLSVCVVPSRFEEPFGLTALEPGFFSVPVIATRCGGLPEVVEDGVTGILVDPGSPVQVASALQLLFEDSSLRRSLGASARARGLERFGAARFVGDFAELLREISSRQRPSGPFERAN